MNRQALENIPVLETERLWLRPLREEYRDQVMIGMSDAEVRHGMLMPVHDTPEKQEAWWNRFKKWRAALEAVQWCAFLKENNRYVALFTVKEIVHAIHRGEIGYSVLQAYWGRGLASEGARVMVDYMFEEVAMHTLIAQILPTNKASQRIVQKLGFEKEGHFREMHFYQGRYYDLLQFSRINPAHGPGKFPLP